MSDREARKLGAETVFISHLRDAWTARGQSQSQWNVFEGTVRTLLRAYDAAMTEGMVLVSREDAQHIVTVSDYAHYGRSAVAGDPLAEKEACDRLREALKVEGSKSTDKKR